MIRVATLILLPLALTACAPKSGSVASARSEVAKTAEAKVDTTEPRSGDAASALSALGLTVFPQPQPRPAIVLEALDGKKLAVAGLHGKYVFLNFWATWCPPCREEMPSIQRMNDQLAGEDFAVYAISVGEPAATVESFLKKTPYSFPIVLDPEGQLSAIFAGRGIPTTYLLDRQGKAIAGIVGARHWDTDEVLTAFKALMATIAE